MSSFVGQEPLRKLRLGMVGGGQGAFIGGVHRYAARLDDQFEFVAGALSSTPEKALISGQELGLQPDRIYPDFQTMAEKEALRVDTIDAVSIVTPNHMHFAAAEAFLQKGISVICDKPMTNTLVEAQRLHDIAERSGAAFILTHNYSGYPMIRQAREMVASGELGAIRVVQAEYAQGWLSERLEETGAKQAEWRTDPSRAGAGGSIGDIGTHAYHLINYVSGLEPESLAADLSTFVSGRALDDNAHILLRYKGGARGMLWSSQVAIGKENDLRLRIYGEKGSLEWMQEEPNMLWYTPLNEPMRKLTRNGPSLSEAAMRVTRIPAGHPEGYLEGFATIYIEAARIIRATQNQQNPEIGAHAPTTQDGIMGVSFIEACVRSHQQNTSWVRL
jgi:predicted dehydrogenase